MKLTRRKFIGTAAAAGTLLGLGKTATAQKIGPVIQPPVRVDNLSRLNYRSFYVYQNTSFMFESESGEIPLQLEAAIDNTGTLKRRTSRITQECFALRFSGSPRFPLTQGTYPVSHFMLGNFDLFITEAGRSGSDHLYLAVINRITTA